MAIQVGTVKSVTGVVKAVDKDTGIERVLTVGSPVYQGESIETTDTSNVLMNMNNGELVTLGRSTTMTLSDDVISSSNTDEGSVSPETIENMLAQGDIDLDALNLDELEATAAGEDGSANEGGVTIARLGLEGNVTSGFDTSGVNAGFGANAEDLIFADSEDPEDPPNPPNPPNPPTPVNTPPTADVSDNGSTLTPLVGADGGSTGGSGGIDLNLDLGGSITLPNVGGVTNIIGDLLGGSSEAGTAGLVDRIVDTATDVVDDITGGLGLPTDTENLDDGLNDTTSDLQEFLTGDDDLGTTLGDLLGGQAEQGTAGSVDHVIDGTTDVIDQVTGGLGLPTDTENLDDGVNNTTTDVQEFLTGEDDLKTTVGDLLGGEAAAGTSGSVDQVVDGATDVVDQVTAGLGLPTNTENLDDGLNNTTTDVQQFLTGEDDLETTAVDLLGNNGSADQTIDGATDVVDQVTAGLGLPTNTENLDEGLDNTTTDVQQLLTGEDDLEATVVDLLGENGSADQIIDGATDVVDQVTAGLGLATDTENLDEGLDNTTTAVQEFLTGDEDLQTTVSSLLGGDSANGTAGTLDQVIGGVTDIVDGLLGTDTSGLDDLVNDVTTVIDDAVAGLGVLDQVSLEALPLEDINLEALPLEDISLDALPLEDISLAETGLNNVSLGVLNTGTANDELLSGNLNVSGSTTSPSTNGESNPPIELGVLDIVNYQPEKVFTAGDAEDEIQYTEMSIDNGVGQDLLGLNKVIGNNEFVVPQNDPTYNYDVTDDGQTVKVSRKDGNPMTEDETNAAMERVEIKDTSVLGSLLGTGAVVGGTYGLTVVDAGGLSATDSEKQFLDVNVLHNGTNDGLSGVADVPALEVLAPVMDALDDALGSVDDDLLNTVGDVLDTVGSVATVLNPVLSPVADLLNQVGGVVTDLTDTLGRETPLGDPTIGNGIADVLGGSLLGGEPDETITAGSVDQVVDGATDVVDQLTAGLGLPT
ncbi:retention module-containing protein, partial [Thiomicrorhabdus sp. 6S2-11]